MFFSVMLYWMWARGERDEQLMALVGCIAFVEWVGELSAVRAVLGV